MESSRADKVAAWLLPSVLLAALLFQNVLSIMTLRELRMLAGNLTGPPGPAQGLTARPATLPPGTAAPEFGYLDTHERSVRLADFREQRVLLVFSSPQCPYCIELYPELKRFSESLEAADLALVLLQLGATPEENRRLKSDQDFRFEILAADEAAFQDYRVPGTPFLVLVDETGGVVRGDTANTYQQIVKLISS